MTDKLTVSQEAREAASRWAKLNSRHQQAANILRGSCDQSPIVQAFARFERDILARTRQTSDVLMPDAYLPSGEINPKYLSPRRDATDQNAP